MFSKQKQKRRSSEQRAGKRKQQNVLGEIGQQYVMKDIESNVQAGSSNSTGLKEQNDFLIIGDVMSDVSDEYEYHLNKTFLFHVIWTSNLMN